MSAPGERPAFTERPVQFGPRNELVGVVTTPVTPPPDGPSRPTLVLLNSGVVRRTGPNRLSVRMARAVAEAGWPAFRFDYAGLGDSGPRAADVDFEEGAQHDIATALEFLRTQAGASSFVLFGLCSGARDAVRGATRDRSVVGAVAIDAWAYRTPGFYLRHFGPRVLRWSVWRSVPMRVVRALRSAGAPKPPTGILRTRRSEPADPDVLGAWPSPRQFEAGVSGLLLRGANLLYGYTGGMIDQYNHERQFAEAFPRLARQTGLTYRFFGDADHTFTAEPARLRLLSTVIRWLPGVPAAEDAARRPPAHDG